MNNRIDLDNNTIEARDSKLKMNATDKYVEWQIKKDKIGFAVIGAAGSGIAYLCFKTIIEIKTVFGL